MLGARPRRQPSRRRAAGRVHRRVRRRRRLAARGGRDLRARRRAPAAAGHRRPDRLSAGRHQPAQGDREAARRELPVGRSLRFVRVVDAHRGARFQPEPDGLHARRRPARRHVLRQPQRSAHQPCGAERGCRPRVAVAGRGRARHGLDQQPGRYARIPDARSGVGLRRASGPHRRQRFDAPYLRALRHRGARRRRSAHRAVGGRRHHRQVERLGRAAAAHVFAEGRAADRRHGFGHRILQLLRPCRARLSGSLVRHHQAPRRGLGQLGARLERRRRRGPHLRGLGLQQRRRLR